MRLLRFFLIFFLLFSLFSLAYSDTSPNVENSLGGLEVSKDTIEAAKNLLGPNYFKFAEPPADLATYVWFDNKSDLLIHIQLPTVDLEKNEVVNTITLSYQIPGNALKFLKNIDRKKYISKEDLSKIKTSKGIKIDDDLDKVLKVYGKPFSHMDHSTHEFIHPDHYQFWYTGEQIGAFAVIILKSSNKVIELQVHYVDW